MIIILTQSNPSVIPHMIYTVQVKVPPFLHNLEGQRSSWAFFVCFLVKSKNYIHRFWQIYIINQGFDVITLNDGNKMHLHCNFFLMMMTMIIIIKINKKQKSLRKESQHKWHFIYPILFRMTLKTTQKSGVNNYLNKINKFWCTL